MICLYSSTKKRPVVPPPPLPHVLFYRVFVGETNVLKVKGSQEAHEAIRPALLKPSPPPVEEGVTPPPTIEGVPTDKEVEEELEKGLGKFLHPADLPLEGLHPHQKALYELVYRRTLASAMAESETDFTVVTLGAGGVVGEEGARDDEVKFCINVHFVFCSFYWYFHVQYTRNTDTEDSGVFFYQFVVL